MPRLFTCQPEPIQGRLETHSLPTWLLVGQEEGLRDEHILRDLALMQD